MGLELPTGWFADRFGHRASLIVGSAGPGDRHAVVLARRGCARPRHRERARRARRRISIGRGSGPALSHLSRARSRRRLPEDRSQDRSRRAGALVLLVLSAASSFTWAALRRAGSPRPCSASLVLAIACAMVEPPAHRLRPAKAADERHHANSLSKPRDVHRAGGRSGRRGVGRVVSRADNRSTQSRAGDRARGLADRGRSGRGRARPHDCQPARRAIRSCWRRLD